MAEEEKGIESQIKLTMASRVHYFREQADSITFEGVRRLLENDLGLDKYALDVHKRYIKQLLSKLLVGDKEDVTKDSEEIMEKDDAKKNLEEVMEKNASSTKEVAESTENHQADKDVKEKSEDERKMEDSPVMGLLTESKSTKSGVVETEDVQKNVIPSESTIKEAIRKRTAFFKANSEEISLAGVRRLLEKDLELDEFTLDSMKKFVREQLNEAFSSKSLSVVQKKSTSRKTSKKQSNEEKSDSDNESGDIEDEKKPNKKIARKGKVQMSEGLKKRKRPEKDTKRSSKKQNKLKEKTSDEKDNSVESGNDSEDGQSQSSEEKPVKKKEVSTPAYGKGVEQLKSIIRSCGMSVAPTVYKKAKQVPDNKREAFLIKELEEILAKEGLSKNSTEKEIKEVKKRKERAKELEGIDTSNIVLSSRRRSTTSYIPPPIPKVPASGDEDDTENTDNDDDDEDDDNSDENGDDNDVEDNDDSQNDDVHEDDDASS